MRRMILVTTVALWAIFGNMPAQAGGELRVIKGPDGEVHYSLNLDNVPVRMLPRVMAAISSEQVADACAAIMKAGGYCTHHTDTRPGKGTRESSSGGGGYGYGGLYGGAYGAPWLQAQGASGQMYFLPPGPDPRLLEADATARYAGVHEARLEAVRRAARTDADHDATLWLAEELGRTDGRVDALEVEVDETKRKAAADAAALERKLAKEAETRTRVDELLRRAGDDRGEALGLMAGTLLGDPAAGEDE